MADRRLMRTIDEIDIAAPPGRVFPLAAEVERWPELLGHYRRVTILSRHSPAAGTVEMAAWRPFGPLRWPAWWVSEMEIDRPALEIRYRHVRGITTGMDVVWRLTPAEQGTHVELVHDWDGPAWPLIGRPAAAWVIGPVFVHGIASRTLAGLKRHAEAHRA